MFIILGIKPVFKVQLYLTDSETSEMGKSPENNFQNQSSNHTVSGYEQEIDLV